MKRREWAWFAAASAVPLALVLTWYAQQSFYPRHDAMDYMMNAQNILVQARAGNGSAIYLERFFRPTVFAAMQAGFLALTGGRVLAAEAASAIVYFAALLLFTWLCLRQYLRARPAALALAMIGTLPWVISTAVISMVEGAFLAAGAAALYAYLRSDRLTLPWASLGFGAMAGWMCMLRPEGGALYAGALLAVASGSAWREGRLRAAGIAAMGVCVGISMAALAGGWRIALAVQLAAAAGLGIAAWRGGRARPLLLAALAAYLLPVLWYTPFYPELYDWIYASTYGPYTATESMRVGLGVPGFVAMIFLWTGGNALALLGVLAVASRRPRAAEPGSGGAGPGSAPIWALLGALGLLLALGAVTLNGDNRFYFGGFLALFSALAVRSLRGKRPRLAAGVIAAITAAHVFYIASYMLPPSWVPGLPFERDAIFALVRPEPLRQLVPWFLTPDRGVDPALTVAEAVAHAPGHGRGESVALVKLDTDSDFDFDRLVDWRALEIISRERSLGTEFELAYVRDGEDAAAYLARLRLEHRYVLVGPVSVTLLRNAASIAARRLIDAARAGRLEAEGFRPQAPIPFDYRGRRDGLWLVERSAK